MTMRLRLSLALLGLLAVLLPAAFQLAPGYMDAEYYLIGGKRLALGHGFTEMVLWNYLDDPAGLPHPSHGYWMPLPSMLAAGGMLLTGRADFASGRILFILFAALMPLLTAKLCYRLTGSLSQARLAGLLGLAPGYYLAYLPTTDAITLVMMIGGLFFWIVLGIDKEMGVIARQAAALGGLAGLMQLSRADGLLWLAVAGLAVWWGANGWRRALHLLAAMAGGYAAAFGGWALRNLVVFGTPLAPGGAKALWLLSYNDLFVYPSSRLSFGRWLEAGGRAMVEARGFALGQNLLATWVVQGLIFLLPLILIGAWQYRRSLAMRSAAAAWTAMFLAMSVAFPFQGVNGGFFHSAAALQPMWWALAPVGLERLLAWGRVRRGWQVERSRPVFQGLLFAAAATLTLALAYGRVIGADMQQPVWNADWRRYQQAEAALQRWGAQPGETVMVNDPPGYFDASQRPAVVLPFGDITFLRAAARRYQAAYLLIDIDQVWDETLASQPGSRVGLTYMGAVEDLQVYRFEWP